MKKALAEGKTAPKYHALTRPARAEAEATHRAIALAEIADVPIYIVHLSAAEALEMVTEARDRGLPAYAETCPQYLFLSYDNYEEPGFEGAKYVMSPPLRAEGDAGPALARAGVQRSAGDLDRPLPVLHEGAEGRSATDDFSKIPNGAPGIETRMSLVYDGGVRTRQDLAQSLRRAHVDVAGEDLRPVPAQRARSRRARTPTSSSSIRRRRCTLSAKTLHMKVDYNPYEGREVTGRDRDGDLARQGDHRQRASSRVGAGMGSFIRRAAR